MSIRRRTSPVIPLFNTSERLEAMFDISRKSVTELRREMLYSEMKEEEEKGESKHEEKKDPFKTSNSIGYNSITETIILQTKIFN